MAGYIGGTAVVSANGAERKKTYTITGTTTSLTGLSYTVNQVHVFHNGVRLVDGTDFTATNGNSITLTSAAESGDEVVVLSYAGYQVSDTVSASQGGTFSGAVTVDADGATVLTVDRATSDGTIIDVQKDGTSVGSIGTWSGTSYIGSGDTGLAFGFGNDDIRPFDPSTVSQRDAAVDLGESGTRFKDLYLSGGVYLGGTGAANKLDDYEEGTWTPVYTTQYGGESQTYLDQSGVYTKIGNLVTVHFNLDITSSTNIGSGEVYISGLPFASGSSSSSQNYNRAPVSTYNVQYDTADGTQMQLYIPSPSQIRLGVLYSRPASTWYTGTTNNFNITTGRAIIVSGSLSYYTDS